MPLWDWLLHTANTMEIRGGSALRAMAGFGHHHRVHEDRFIELGGSLIVEVEFIVPPEEKERLVETIAAENPGCSARTFRRPLVI